MAPPNTALNEEKITAFEKELQRICRMFGVWIKTTAQREERPGDSYLFYEFSLSAKVSKLPEKL